MIEIGKGETQTIIFRLLPQESGVLSVDDTILFALKDIDDTVILTKESLVSELEVEGEEYRFLVTIPASITITMDYKIPYFYDITLIDSLGQKESLTDVKGIKIVKTVGASIVPTNEENASESAEE